MAGFRLYKPPAVLRGSTRRKRAGRLWTPGEVEEFGACGPRHGVGGFLRFCERHVIIQDRETAEEYPFRLWEGQRRLAPWLVAWDWILGLKGRQGGFTWVVAAYATWRIRYEATFYCPIINQGMEYADETVERFRFIHDRLPGWAQVPLVRDRGGELRFRDRQTQQDSTVKSVASSKKAGRSLTGECTIFDEAAFQEHFAKAVGAILPMMLRSSRSGRRAQAIVLSTSEGPGNPFADLWHNTYGMYGEKLDGEGRGPSGFRPIFFHWSERPGREDPWYDQTKARLDAVSPILIKQEYPNTIEEAFEHATGRIYPTFSAERNVGRVEIPADAPRGRAIDWGESIGAWVVLWFAHVKGPPGLLVSPDCPETIRELQGYRLDDRGMPDRECDDHACDALRYAVVTHDLRGLVYVYREIYERDSLVKGESFMDEIRRIHEASGWERRLFRGRERWRPKRDGELFKLGTVADRSQRKIHREYTTHGVPCVPHLRPTDQQIQRAMGGSKRDTDSEVLQGVRLVQALMVGSERMDRYHAITREEEALQVYRDLSGPGVRRAPTMREERMRKIAQQLLGRRRGG